MRALSLFSGIGGIDLAGEWAGIHTVAFCEREPYPVRVLKQRFNGIPIYDDVCKLTAKQLEEDGILGADRAIDLISGGFPCQPFSAAGKRGGTEDDRYLWPEMFRIITEVRPTWVVAENVDGLISMDQSDGEFVLEDATAICKDSEMVLETIRRDFAEAGYDSIPIVIPSAAVGAPHRRDRVFILGYTEHPRSYGAAVGRSAHPTSYDDKEGQNEAVESSGTSRSENNGAMAYAACELSHGGGAEGRRRSESTNSGEALADSNYRGFKERKELDGEPKEDSPNWNSRRRYLDGCNNESFWPLADSSGERCGEARELQRGGAAERASSGGEDVAYANIAGTQRSQNAGSTSGNGQESRNKHLVRLGSDDAGRTTEPSLGRVLDGLSAWLDGFRWPAGLGQPQYDWEPPRVATGVKHRASRLKALGNAVNPAQIFPVLYFIKQINDSLQAK